MDSNKKNRKKRQANLEIYYWSKFDEDEKLAGGDIRAMYMIPELIKLSPKATMVITPDNMIPGKLLRKNRILSRIFLLLLFPLYALKKLKSGNFKPSFIYCSTCYFWDIFPATLIKLLFRCKVACVSHDTPKQLEGYSFYRKSENFGVIRSAFFTTIGQFQVFLLNFVDIPISISRFALDFFNPEIRKRAILSSNGISHVIEENEINTNRVYDIVILGRVIPRKNVPNIFRCLSGRIFPRKIKLLLITNTDMDAVEPIIKSNLDEKVIDLKVEYDATEEKKLNLLKQSKLYISLSRDETFSIATLEAASMGVALILSDYEFFRDIYGEAAIYISPDDLESLWREIQEFLTIDEKLLKYSKLALQLAKNYIYANIAEKEYERITTKLQGEG